MSARFYDSVLITYTDDIYIQNNGLWMVNSRNNDLLLAFMLLNYYIENAFHKNFCTYNWNKMWQAIIFILRK